VEAISVELKLPSLISEELIDKGTDDFGTILLWHCLIKISITH